MFHGGRKGTQNGIARILGYQVLFLGRLPGDHFTNIGVSDENIWVSDDDDFFPDSNFLIKLSYVYVFLLKFMYLHIKIAMYSY